MIEVGVHEAKTHLSRLLAQVEKGEEVVIRRGGQRVALLVRIREERRPKFGTFAGRLEVADDFDAPLPADVQEAFES